jgi:hypothetical protein
MHPPLVFSPNKVRNMVKLSGPGASSTIAFRVLGSGSRPGNTHTPREQPNNSQGRRLCRFARSLRIFLQVGGACAEQNCRGNPMEFRSVPPSLDDSAGSQGRAAREARHARGNDQGCISGRAGSTQGHITSRPYHGAFHQIMLRNV